MTKLFQSCCTRRWPKRNCVWIQQHLLLKMTTMIFFLPAILYFHRNYQRKSTMKQIVVTKYLNSRRRNCIGYLLGDYMSSLRSQLSRIIFFRNFCRKLLSPHLLNKHWGRIFPRNNSFGSFTTIRGHVDSSRNLWPYNFKPYKSDRKTQIQFLV